MSDEERFGYRDLTYSQWHRPSSGFLSPSISYIDLDCCEYCKSCYAPLVLLELAKDVGQKDKPVMVTHHLAKRANLPAYLVFYRPNLRRVELERQIRLLRSHLSELESELSGIQSQEQGVKGGIDGFRVKQIYPEGSFAFELPLTPEDYASWLTGFHDEHRCHH